MSQNSMRRKNWSDILAILLMLTTSLLLFYRVLGDRVASGDIASHANFTLLLIRNPEAFFSAVPHFLYHVVVAFLASLINRGDIVQSVFRTSTITLLLVQAYMLIMIYMIFRWRFALSHGKRLMLTGLLLLLLIVAPINFILSPERLYFGYISITIYHNPTTIFLRPFAILAFFATLMTFYPLHYVIKSWTPIKRAGMIVLFATIMILGTLAKPSFTIVIVPTAILFSLYRWWQKQFVHWELLVMGIILPSLGIIAYQSLLLGDSTGVDLGSPTFYPLRLFDQWDAEGRPGANELLGIKFLLSIAFPLVVYITHWQRATRSTIFNLGWLTMSISTFYAYGWVYENYVSAGDFIWGAYVSLFIMFVVALIFLFRVYGQEPMRQWLNWRLIIVSFVFTLHVLAGINWYYLHVLSGFKVLSYFY